jgi:membrane-associated phospholipid phosphatase
VLTAFVVMATGNHYLLDVLAGAAVLALASVAVTSASRERPGPGLRRRPRGTSHRRRP